MIDLHKVKNLGQVYTPVSIVQLMFELSTNNNSILEPSAGEGVFTGFIKSNSNRDITSIEIDPDNKNDNKNDNFIIMDFFDYDESNKFSTIIGNPPYVLYKNINIDTLSKIESKNYFRSFDKRTNLFLFFIRKSIEHLEEYGELILITPREFIKATSSISLNNHLYKSGTITHWYEYGDKALFKGYSSNVVVWRFEKNNFSRETKTINGMKKFNLLDGQLIFSNEENKIKFSDLFFVKVGAVSGMDDVFTNENGNSEFVCSFTKKTGELKKMFFNIKNDYLSEYKDLLINRKIKKFNEDNWWQWGRGLYESNLDRIYVNCKTRDDLPFFTNKCKYYDGTILAIFPKKEININKTIEILNNVDWDELGFKVGGRLCFSQKALENTYLPEIFNSLI